MSATLKHSQSRKILSDLAKETLHNTNPASQPNCHLIIGTQATLIPAASIIVERENNAELGAAIISDNLLRRRHPFDAALRINIGDTPKEPVLLTNTKLDADHLVRGINHETRFDYVNTDLGEWRTSLIERSARQQRDIFIISDLAGSPGGTNVQLSSDLANQSPHPIDTLVNKLNGYDLHIHQIMTNPIWDAIRSCENELLIRQNGLQVGWESSVAIEDVTLLERLAQSAEITSFSIHRPDRFYAEQYSTKELRSRGDLLSVFLYYQAEMNSAIAKYIPEGIDHLQRLNAQLRPFYEENGDQYLPTLNGDTTAQAAINTARRGRNIEHAYENFTLSPRN